MTSQQRERLFGPISEYRDKRDQHFFGRSSIDQTQFLHPWTVGSFKIRLASSSICLQKEATFSLGLVVLLELQNSPERNMVFLDPLAKPRTTTFSPQKKNASGFGCRRLSGSLVTTMSAPIKTSKTSSTTADEATPCAVPDSKATSAIQEGNDHDSSVQSTIPMKEQERQISPRAIETKSDQRTEKPKRELIRRLSQRQSSRRLMKMHSCNNLNTRIESITMNTNRPVQQDVTLKTQEARRFYLMKTLSLSKLSCNNNDAVDHTAFRGGDDFPVRTKKDVKESAKRLESSQMENCTSVNDDELSRTDCGQSPQRKFVLNKRTWGVPVKRESNAQNETLSQTDHSPRRDTRTTTNEVYKSPCRHGKGDQLSQTEHSPRRTMPQRNNFSGLIQQSNSPSESYHTPHRASREQKGLFLESTMHVKVPDDVYDSPMKNLTKMTDPLSQTEHSPRRPFLSQAVDENKSPRRLSMRKGLSLRVIGTAWSSPRKASDNSSTFSGSVYSSSPRRQSKKLSKVRSDPKNSALNVDVKQPMSEAEKIEEMEKALALSLLELEDDNQNESRKTSKKETSKNSPRRISKKSTTKTSTSVPAQKQKVDVSDQQSRSNATSPTNAKAEKHSKSMDCKNDQKWFSPRRISPKKVVMNPTTERRAFNTIEDALGEYDEIVSEDFSFRDLNVHLKDASMTQNFLPLSLKTKFKPPDGAQVEGPSQSVSNLLLQYDDIAFSDETDRHTSLMTSW